MSVARGLAVEFGTEALSWKWWAGELSFGGSGWERLSKSKRAKDAQRYMRKGVVPKATGSVAAPPAREASPVLGPEPLSTIPMLEPKSRGSLNPLPPWKSGL